MVERESSIRRLPVVIVTIPVLLGTRVHNGTWTLHVCNQKTDMGTGENHTFMTSRTGHPVRRRMSLFSKRRHILWLCQACQARPGMTKRVARRLDHI